MKIYVAPAFQVIAQKSNRHAYAVERAAEPGRVAILAIIGHGMTCANGANATALPAGRRTPTRHAPSVIPAPAVDLALDGFRDILAQDLADMLVDRGDQVGARAVHDRLQTRA